MTFCNMNLMQKCLLFPMVGLKSDIFAFIADNFIVEVCSRTYGPPCTMYVQRGLLRTFYHSLAHQLFHPALPAWTVSSPS